MSCEISRARIFSERINRFCNLLKQVYKQDQKETTIEPTVSIVVPVFNGAATIKMLLDSLLEIDYPKAKVEIIIVDGVSTDQTRQILAEYPAKLLIEEKKGPNAARNAGITHSTGEIIAFTDSDCVVSKNWVKRAVSNFTDFRVGCVGGDVRSLDDDFLSRYACNSFAPVIRLCKTRKELDRVGPVAGCPVGCNMFFRRRTLSDAGNFDESIQYSFEEDELIDRVCKAGHRVVLDPEVIVWHKHRSKLKSFLAQSFKYGRGAGKMLKRPNKQRFFQRWLIANFCILAQTITMIGLGAFMILEGNWQNVLLFFSAIFLVPFIVLVAIYGFRATLNREKWESVIYPGVDFVRVLAFMTGEFCGFIMKT